MASESGDSRAMTVSLPPELAEWLDEQATDLDLDREAVLVQLLASYRAVAELEDDPALASLLSDEEIDTKIVEPAVGEVLSSHLPDISNAVEDRIAEDLAERLAADFDDRLDDVEADFQEKIQDVRERVIQVKRETDGKAPAEHDHEELQTNAEQIADIRTDLDVVESSLTSLESDVDDSIGALAEQIDEIEATLEDGDVRERLEDVESKLRTVAWVVSDLRDAQTSNAGRDAVEQIKRTAAENDVSRAVCDNCGNGIELGLLTEPNCPHCDATVTDIDPSSGLFSKPRLLVAAQIEGSTESDRNDVRRDEMDDIATNEYNRR